MLEILLHGYGNKEPNEIKLYISLSSLENDRQVQTIFYYDINCSIQCIYINIMLAD